MSFSAAMDALHEDIFGHDFFIAELADEPLDSSPTLAPCDEEPPETPEPVNEPSASSLYIQPSTLPDCNGHTRSLSSRCHIRIINITIKIYPEKHSFLSCFPNTPPYHIQSTAIYPSRLISSRLRAPWADPGRSHQACTISHTSERAGWCLCHRIREELPMPSASTQYLIIVPPVTY